MEQNIEICPYCSNDKTKYHMKVLKHLGVRMCTNPKCPVSMSEGDSVHLSAIVRQSDHTLDGIKATQSSDCKSTPKLVENEMNVFPKEEKLICPNCSDDKNTHYIEMLDNIGLLLCSNEACSLVIPDDEDPKMFLAGIAKEKAMLSKANRNEKSIEVKYSKSVDQSYEEPVNQLHDTTPEQSHIIHKTHLKKCDEQFSINEPFVVQSHDQLSPAVQSHQKHDQQLVSDQILHSEQHATNLLCKQNNEFQKNQSQMATHHLHNFTDVQDTPQDFKNHHNNILSESLELCQENNSPTRELNDKDVLLLCEKDLNSTNMDIKDDNPVILEQSKDPSTADSDFLCIPATQENSSRNEINVEQRSVISKNDLRERYIMWENDLNLCWLNSSLHLLAHNRTIKSIIMESCIIKDIIRVYQAVTKTVNKNRLSNSDVKVARKKLAVVQKHALEYLSPIIKCKTGIPDSSFCAIMNLINQSKICKKLFEVKLSWNFACKKCLRTKVHVFKKAVITLSKVDHFNPVAPLALCICPLCKEPDQERQLSYISTSKCLIFHFENGAGKGVLTPQDFSLKDQKYFMTGVILLKKLTSNLNHFLTWIRNPKGDCWLECDDLNKNPVFYNSKNPEINLEEVHMIMYETNKKENSPQDCTETKIKREPSTPERRSVRESYANFVSKASDKVTDSSLFQLEDALIDLTEIDEISETLHKKLLDDTDSSSQGSIDVSKDAGKEIPVDRTNSKNQDSSSASGKSDINTGYANTVFSSPLRTKRKKLEETEKIGAKQSKSSEQLPLSVFADYNEDDIAKLPVFNQIFGSSFEIDNSKMSSTKLENKLPLQEQLRYYVKSNTKECDKSYCQSKEDAISRALANVDEIVELSLAGLSTVFKNNLGI